MIMAYPINLKRQKDGAILATFPDVPEALTEGESVNEVLTEAHDALVAALGGYINERRAIPPPAKAKRGQRLVFLPPLPAAKLALYQAMRDAKLTNVALGRRLKITEAAVRRLIDLDHRSHIGQVEDALAVLGKRLVVEVGKAA
jgi:antitoxin HicB